MPQSLRVEVLLAELTTELKHFAEAQKELRQEVRDNMATVEDMELIRVGYIKADEQLDKKLDEIKKTIREDYVPLSTFRWTLLLAVVLAGAAAKIDFMGLLHFLTKGIAIP